MTLFLPSIFLGLLNPIREVEQCRVTRNFIFIAEGFVFAAVHLCYCHWHTSFVGMDFQCQAAPDRKKFLKREWNARSIQKDFYPICIIYPKMSAWCKKSLYPRMRTPRCIEHHKSIIFADLRPEWYFSQIANSQKFISLKDVKSEMCKLQQTIVWLYFQIGCGNSKMLTCAWITAKQTLSWRTPKM